MMYIRFPLSLRNVEDLLHERVIDVSHETVRQTETSSRLSDSTVGDVHAAPNVPVETALEAIEARGPRLHADGEEGFR